MSLSLETMLREVLAAEDGTTDVNPEMLVQQLASTLELLVATATEQKLASWFEAIKVEFTGMLTDLNVQQLKITQDIVTRLIDVKVDERIENLEIPLEGVSKDAVIASCVLNRQIKTLEGRMDVLATEVSGLVEQYWSFNENWRKHEMRLLKHEAAYLSHKEWINHCWTAYEKLTNVVQQNDFELKMLKERVNELEEEKLSDRIKALQISLETMALCGGGAAAAAA